jgi:uncharacterized protein YgbK (DUF1537 family)
VKGLAFAAIADDFTGAVDLAGMLVRGGLRTAVAAGVNGLTTIRGSGADAVVVALKTRSIEPRLAVEASIQAAEALRSVGAKQLYFKYCSTFDSTLQGNIGPVAEALRAFLGASAVPFVPSFPENGRRVYRGHLFVGDALLNESGMEYHSLNPMRDANLVRVLAGQSQAGVGLINRETVQRGPVAVKEALARCAGGNAPLAIVDAIEASDLKILAAALLECPLVTGGSALGLYLARRLAGMGTTDAKGASALAPRAGRCAVLAGSCSIRTREQIAHFTERRSAPQMPALQLPLPKLSEALQSVVDSALSWFEHQPAHLPALIYSPAAGTEDAGNQEAPVLSVGRQIERAFAAIAQGLAARGVTRLVVAGGETSGAVVTALDVAALEIGPEISPGVSWAQVIGGGRADGLCLALKSGNFGPPDLFTSAFEQLRVAERAA